MTVHQSITYCISSYMFNNDIKEINERTMASIQFTIIVK